VAVVLTLVQTKQIRTIQKHSKYKCIFILPKHPHITKHVKTTTIQDIPKRNSHNIIKYPHYKFIWHVYPQELHRNSLPFPSLQNKITSHKSRQFTSLYFTLFWTLCNSPHFASDDRDPSKSVRSSPYSMAESNNVQFNKRIIQRFPNCYMRADTDMKQLTGTVSITLPSGRTTVTDICSTLVSGNVVFGILSPSEILAFIYWWQKYIER